MITTFILQEKKDAILIHLRCTHTHTRVYIYLCMCILYYKVDDGKTRSPCGALAVVRLLVLINKLFWII